MNFRQIHLDFHTSELIPGIGTKFDKHEFQDILLEAAVDSITCFSLCHHGWSYHPTKIGNMHPNLTFNLLRAQIDACHEVGIKVPVYLSAGFNADMVRKHTDWRVANPSGDEKFFGNLDAGFKKLCFNTPYLDYLCALIEEAAEMFPDGDGIFLDIVPQSECCCQDCIRDMKAQGYNPENQADRQAFADKVSLKYYERTVAAAKKFNPEMRVFHNSGHVAADKPELLKYFSHLELESLPTGGWGYDHFPQSAAFARKTGMEFLGMTGKFHNTWGEFGGIKHPNALRYECSAMLAEGSKCSIGDQLHPNGQLDRTTYAVIGTAYREVREKEPYCQNARNISDIALITAESAGGPRNWDKDPGAVRILQEGQYLFDILTPDMDIENYKMVIVNEGAVLTDAAKKRLHKYLANGGKILVSGGIDIGADAGCTFGEIGPYDPTYILPSPDVRPTFLSTPFVVYDKNREIKVTDGQSLGDVYYPYFNRAWDHFCSHQHAPYIPEPTGFSLGVRKGNLITLALPFFSIYQRHGIVVLREMLEKIIAELLDDDNSVRINMPSTARLRYTEDIGNRRNIVHLLYGNTVKRGNDIEVIEELLPLCDLDVAVKVNHPIESVTLEPGGKRIPFTPQDGRIHFHIDKFVCHQMVALNWK